MLNVMKWTTGLFFIIFISVTGAYAQATRTWVSGVGDDANPCSRTAPCKTFAGAISKTAASGEIDVLDPGGFGAVTITKAITIDGSGGSTAGVLVSGTNGIVVQAGPNDAVTLRNLDINGLGTGINGVRLLSGAALYIENTKIYGFTNYGIDIEPAASSAVTVDRTLVRENTTGNMLVKPGVSGSAVVTISGSRFENSHSGSGVRAEDRSQVTVSNSIASGNAGSGFLSISSGGAGVEISIENCIASYNDVSGIRASGTGAYVILSNSMSTNNIKGIDAVSGGALLSFGNNRIAANSTDGTPTATISAK